MGVEFDALTPPTDGERVTYSSDEGFGSPDAPVVPVAHGAADTVIRATRHVLDAVADRMGREIVWFRVYVGTAARDRYGTPLPDDTVRALSHYRLGLLGSLADDRATAVPLERALRQRVGLTATVARHSRLAWLPSPIRAGDLDVTVFRDVTEDADAGLDYPPDANTTDALRDTLDATGVGTNPTEPTGYSVAPASRDATEALVDAAVEYAFDRDRRTVTVAHQHDARPGADGSFRAWAHDYLTDEYDRGTIDEDTYRVDYPTGGYPDDELVVFDRRLDDLYRTLLVDPEPYDVVVAPSLAGSHLSAVAAEGVGKTGGAAEVELGDGRLVAAVRPSDAVPGAVAATNPIALLLASGVLFEYLGWLDAAHALRSALSATLADGVVPQAVHRRTGRGTPVSANGFADAVVDRLRVTPGEPGAGGVATTADERAAIRRVVAGTHDVLFTDTLSPAAVTLNQLFDPDVEADVALPEIGLNFHYWRRWPPERRLEVLLHEFAHAAAEDAGDVRDHGDVFYAELVALVDVATDWLPELEDVFDEPLDAHLIRRYVVASVNEDTIEPDDTVPGRKRWLRDRLDLPQGD